MKLIWELRHFVKINVVFNLNKKSVTLSFYGLNLLPELGTLPRLVAVSLAKVHIQIFQIVTLLQIVHVIKGLYQHLAEFSVHGSSASGEVYSA